MQNFITAKSKLYIDEKISSIIRSKLFVNRYRVR